MRHGFRHSCRNSSDLRGEIPESCDPGRHSPGPMALKASVCNTQVPQAALKSRSPLQAMKDWHKLKPKLFRKKPYILAGCDGIAGPPVHRSTSRGVWIFSCHATDTMESLGKPPMICATGPWPLDHAQGHFPACECC